MTGRLFFLEISGGHVLSANADGSDLKSIVVEGRKIPDGIAVDVARGRLYWTNMGHPTANDGSILSSDLEGSQLTTIVPPGATFTPKQLQIEKDSGKLYWCDREGMRVMRANLDASNIERPSGQSPAARTDIELLYDGLPEPIDLEIDPVSHTLYWTDRGDPPRGNTVNRAPLDSPAGARKAPEILASHLMEGIGLALDPQRDRMFFTDLGGSVYRANLDGSNEQTILYAQGNLTGIAYAELPATNGRSKSR